MLFNMDEFIRGSGTSSLRRRTRSKLYSSPRRKQRLLRATGPSPSARCLGWSPSGGGSSREGKGRAMVIFENAIIARGSSTAGSMHDSKIKIGIARGSRTAVKKGNTQDTGKRVKDEGE